MIEPDQERGLEEGRGPSQQAQDEPAGWGRALRLLGGVTGMGVELALLVVCGAWCGGWLQRRLGVGSWVVVLSVGACCGVFVWHVRHVLGSGGGASADQGVETADQGDEGAGGGDGAA